MASTKKRTWINSIVLVSAKKLEIHKSTGRTLLMLKIYSGCLMCILKVKYIQNKFSYLTTDSSA